jgi:long-chain acyl-CoA synthetase
VAPAWAEARGIEYSDLTRFSEEPEVQQEIARAIAEANDSVARVEQIKKWTIVGDEWSPESGEVTPSLKLKRRVVLDKYADQIDAMYTGV